MTRGTVVSMETQRLHMRNLGWVEIEDVTWMYSEKKKDFIKDFHAVFRHWRLCHATFDVHGAWAQSFSLDETTCTRVNINNPENLSII